jgi:hypothetical protein
LTDPPATNAELWNWQLNVGHGSLILDQDYRDADSFPRRARLQGDVDATDFSEEQKWKQTFLYYNQGYRGPRPTYWRWVYSNPRRHEGSWVRNDADADTWVHGDPVGRCYADQAWYAYQNYPCGN